MKKIFTLALLLVVASGVMATEVSAQRILSLGAKAGYSIQGVNIAQGNKNDFYNVSGRDKSGFHAALVGRVKLLGLHVQPELMYSYTSYGLDVSPKGRATAISRTSSTVRMHSIDLPVAVGIKLLWFRLQAGPSFNLLTKTSIKDKGNIRDMKLSVPPISFVAGIGFDMMRFSLDVRYHGQFKRAKQNIVYDGDDRATEYRTRLSNWMFSVGYMF